MRSLRIDGSKKACFYSERDREMYELTLSEILGFIESFEPWEEIDAEIFDVSYEWFIAVTHEDISFVYGF